MATENKRTLVYLPPEWEDELRKIKRAAYPDQSIAEMYRQLLFLGIDSLKEKHEKDHSRNSA